MTPVFRHPLLTRPLDLQGQRDLIAAYGVFRASQDLTHSYDGRQSSGGDQRLTKGGSLGRKYVTPKETREAR